MSDKEERAIWLDYYTGEDCIDCGRICEKCHTDQDTGEIVYDRFI